MQRDAEVTAEDEQLFLMKLQTQMSKQPAAGQRVCIVTPHFADMFWYPSLTLADANKFICHPWFQFAAPSH